MSDQMRIYLIEHVFAGVGSGGFGCGFAGSSGRLLAFVAFFLVH